MNKSYPLGTFLGLHFTLLPSSLAATGGLWLLLMVVGYWIIDLSLPEAILGGLIAVILHWVGEVWHQYGHAFAARRVGYPMQGIEFWWFFGRSVYPADEPELPARVHIRRALGGAPASFVLTLIVGAILLGLRQSAGVSYWIALFAFLEYLFVYTLGAFLPLGFTDGSTLIRYWGKD